MKRFNKGEELLAKHLKELRLQFERQFPFAFPRKWMADFKITNRLLNGQEVLIEVEGGTWSGGRHTRGKGYEDDCVKYSTAAAKGYSVFRFTTGQVESLFAKEFIKRWLCR